MSLVDPNDPKRPKKTAAFCRVGMDDTPAGTGGGRLTSHVETGGELA